MELQEHAITGDITKAEPCKEVIETLSALTKGNVTPQAAGEFLKRLGFWQPLEHIGPLQAGLTEEFPDTVEVSLHQLMVSFDSVLTVPTEMLMVIS